MIASDPEQTLAPISDLAREVIAQRFTSLPVFPPYTDVSASLWDSKFLETASMID